VATRPASVELEAPDRGWRAGVQGSNREARPALSSHRHRLLSSPSPATIGHGKNKKGGLSAPLSRLVYRPAARQVPVTPGPGSVHCAMKRLASIGFACDSGVYAFRSRSPARPGVGCFYSGIKCARHGRTSIGRNRNPERQRAAGSHGDPSSSSSRKAGTGVDGEHCGTAVGRQMCLQRRQAGYGAAGRCSTERIGLFKPNPNGPSRPFWQQPSAARATFARRELSRPFRPRCVPP